MIIDDRSLTAEASADLVIDRFEAGCFAKGLTPGPFSGANPQGSLADALLGRAGRRSPRYGELWDRILALEAELPAGRTVRTLGAPRAATGPDVRRTILEACGRLGRVSKVWVRLRPAPRDRIHLSAEVGGVPAALQALGRVMRAQVRPALVDLEGDANVAQLSLRFEGEGRLVAAEVALAHRVLAAEGIDAVEAPAMESAHADPKVSLIVEGYWARLPDLVREALGQTGRSMSHPAELLWLTHEAAAVAVPWPRATPPVPVRNARAEAVLDELARALERRCA